MLDLLVGGMWRWASWPTFYIHCKTLLLIAEPTKAAGSSINLAQRLKFGSACSEAFVKRRSENCRYGRVWTAEPEQD
jgi:hypothetical protein